MANPIPTDDEARALIMLEDGIAPKEVAKQTGVSYAKVQSLHNQLKRAKESDNMEVLLHTPLLNELADAARENHPSIAAEIDAFVENVKDVKDIEHNLVASLNRCIRQANIFLDTNKELTIKDWQVITNTLANVYQAVFNKSGTTVQVNNLNAPSDKALTLLKGGLRD